MFSYITLHKIIYWILLSMDTLSPNLFCTLICISFSLNLTGDIIVIITIIIITGSLFWISGCFVAVGFFLWYRRSVVYLVVQVV